jgi:hypothetical protein
MAAPQFSPDLPPEWTPEPSPISGPRLRLVPDLPPEELPPELPLPIPLLVGLIVLLWPSETAPPWADELNPVTGRPYKDEQEYRELWNKGPDEVKRRIAEAQLQRANAARTKAFEHSETDPLVCVMECTAGTTSIKRSDPPVMPGHPIVPRTPAMPDRLSEEDQDLWRECFLLHKKYKQLQQAAASISSPENKRILKDVANNRATPQERLNICDAVDQQIQALEKLHRLRKKYIDSRCDKFDWYQEGRTETERRADHEEQLNIVFRNLIKLRRWKNRFC